MYAFYMLIDTDQPDEYPCTAIMPANSSRLYCQLKWLFIGPMAFAPAMRLTFEMVIYKVNCVADFFSQQHCMAVANTAMVLP